MLLDDIIAALSDSKGSLTDALFKTKILLRQLGHKELVTWVNAELTGYEKNAELPQYRRVQTIPHGHVILNGWEYKDTLLPVGTLTENLQKNVTQMNVSSSISTIEDQVRQFKEKSTGLVRQLSPEYLPYLSKGLVKGAGLMSAWCEINMAEFEGIVIEVRSRLLDFCLELQEQLGGVSEQDVPAKAATIDTPKLFQTIVYGGTVIVGSQHIQVSNQTGDIEGLLAEVAKLGFDQGELAELKQAVLEDKGKGETPSVTDGETSKWYVKALKTLGKGARDVGVDVATKVIVESLKHFSGG
jgi:hypothetical protein